MIGSQLSKLFKASPIYGQTLKQFSSASNPFYLQQLSTPCLAEFAYYVESNGEAAIIDPLRETKPYLDLAKSRNAKIKYILQTHFHADFVSGHVDLARQTGAKIVYGPNAEAAYDLYSAKDNEELPLGEITLKVIHTPGHTLESSCYLLLDQDKKPYSLFTGDTLFLGEVGRPDLAVNTEMTKEDLASMLYDSLRNKIMPLDDNIIVYPAHGAGSGCGKNIAKGTSCTLGKQKASNYALQPMTKSEFIEAVAGSLSKAPKYYPHDVAMNKSNYTSLDEVMKRSLHPLTTTQVKDWQSKGALVVDCREPADCFKTGIVPNSVTISLSLPFAVWVGTLLNPKDKIVIVCDPGKEEETIMRLARVGFENCVGYLKNGFQEWANQKEAIQPLKAVDPKNHIEEMQKSQGIQILDVRNKPEWEVGVYGGSHRIPLGELPDRVEELDKTKPYHILCKGGFRAAIASSLLSREGFKDLTVIKGGADKLTAAGFKLDEYKEGTN